MLFCFQVGKAILTIACEAGLYHPATFFLFEKVAGSAYSL